MGSLNYQVTLNSLKFSNNIVVDIGKSVKMGKLNKEKIINNKEIKLNEKLLKDNELIKLLIEEVKEIKDKTINELIRENEEKENKIKRMEKKI